MYKLYYILARHFRYPYFHIYVPQDVQNKLRDACKKLGDEFMTCKYATQAKVWFSFIWLYMLNLCLCSNVIIFSFITVINNKYFLSVLWLLLQDYLPGDIQSQFSSSRELIKNIHNSFQKLRDRAERMSERSKENATDLLMFGKELRYCCFWIYVNPVNQWFSSRALRSTSKGNFQGGIKCFKMSKQALKQDISE